jgi:two-component sensor histidine kinase
MLTLCLHELATNAVKYGALSNGTDQVHIDWAPVADGDQRKVRLSWRESGGRSRLRPVRDSVLS